MCLPTHTRTFSSSQGLYENASFAVKSDSPTIGFPGTRTGSSPAQPADEKMPKQRFTTIPQTSIFNCSDVVKKKIQLNRFFRLTHPAFYEPSHLLSG